MRSAIWKALALIVVASMLGACSKSSSVGGNPAAPSSSNWDSMNWDQGNWS